MQFDRGYLSPYFVTDPQKMECELEDPYILIYEKKISRNKDLVPVLEKVLQPGQADPDHLPRKSTARRWPRWSSTSSAAPFKCCAVKAPGYGDRRKAMLEDIAILTGGKAIFEDLGMQLENVELADLGRAKKVKIDKDNTTIIEGAGKRQAIQAPHGQPSSASWTSRTSDYDKEKLSERIAKLSGGVAKINVGAATESEMKEKKVRVEDAMHATRAANQEGILPGGGVALLRASPGPEAGGADATTRRSATTSSCGPARRRSSRSPRTPARTAPWSCNKVLENKDAELRLRRPPGPLLRHGQGRHHRPDQGGAVGACRTRPAWRRCC